MSEISVVVVGSTSINSVVGNGDTVNVNVGDQTIGGGNGAAATIQAGTVTTIDATQTATVTNVGSAYAAKFNFSLPRGYTGSAGPANSLSVSKVSTGTTAAVSISGTAPSQTLSFVLQPGPTGPANSLSIGSVSTGTTAAVSITGSAPSQSLSFVLPQGPAGSPNTLSIGSVSTGTTAAVSITGSAPSQSLSFVLPLGPTGPANSLSIGSVSTGTTAAVSISGSAPSQSLSFVLPLGPTGPATSLSIGSVTTGTTAAVSISGSAPSQSLSFVLPAGPQGATGATGPQGPSGSVNLADETPQPLGTASAGTALTAARADHVHSQGSIAYSALTGIPSTFAPAAHTHSISTVIGLQDALDDKQPVGTYATLVNNLIPSVNLPSFVDDVVDVGGTLPASGDVGKIYVVSTGANTNKIYRWSGSTFIEISPSPGSTDSVTEGSTNLYFTNARAAAAAPVQSVAGRTGTVTLTKSDVGLGNVPNTDATARANHTGTQTASTISDFATEAAKYGPVTSVSGRTGVITVAQLGTSGTASSSTFLRGDGQWSPAGSTDASALTSGTVAAARLPLATTTAAGAVIVGNGLAVSSGILSSSGGYNPADAPMAPTGVYYDTNVSPPRVRWTASPGGVAVKYEVQATSNQTDYTTASASVTATELAFTSGYKFRVRGINFENLAGEWGYQEGLTPPGGGSGSYTLPTATSSVLGGIKVGANLTITDGVLAASGGGSGSIVEATTAASFPATGSAGTLYHAKDAKRIFFWDASGVYVEAGPSGGGGSSGDGTDSVLRALFVPPAPTSVSATAGNTQASLTWSAPTVLSQTPITNYTVQYSSNSGSTWTTFTRSASTATSATVTALTNGTAYTFRVAATNGAGTGAYSTASSAVTPGNTLEVLVVAGGGGSGTSVGGGGGGGGVVYSSAVSYASGVQYTVTVGGGGASVGSNSAGTSGSNSSLASLVASAVGGGGGGSFGGQLGGKTGGSGGGGCGFTTDSRSSGGSGTSGQGYSGGNGTGTFGSGGSGGGGGAASAGGNADGGNAGAGGDGVGSYSTLAAAASVGVLYSGTRYFSGGGAGISTGSSNQVTAVNGSNSVGSAGTANSGQGAGGDAGTAGGSGVVIIRTAATAASTTGSPTVTQSGGFNVYTFTGSGSITF